LRLSPGHWYGGEVKTVFPLLLFVSQGSLFGFCQQLSALSRDVRAKQSSCRLDRESPRGFGDAVACVIICHDDGLCVWKESESTKWTNSPKMPRFRRKGAEDQLQIRPGEQRREQFTAVSLPGMEWKLRRVDTPKTTPLEIAESA
jgi:hypothetical protein